MVNHYLAAAYILFWLIFMVYSWIIYGRQKRLEQELKEIKTELGQEGASNPKL